MNPPRGLTRPHPQAKIRTVVRAQTPTNSSSPQHNSRASTLPRTLAGADRDAKAKELVGYLETIESSLKNGDVRRSGTYLVEGRQSLNLARLSRSDDTLQFYTLSFPARWNASKAYPLHIYLHGRESDLPLSLVASTFTCTVGSPICPSH